MAFRRRFKRSRNGFAKRRRGGRFSKSKTRNFRKSSSRNYRVAKAAAWTQIKRASELKWGLWSADAMPGAPANAMNTTFDIRNNTFGNAFFSGGSAPGLMDPLNDVANGNTSLPTGMIGNKILLKRIKYNLLLQPDETQLSYDNCACRVSLLRFKQNWDSNLSSANNQDVTRALMFAQLTSAGPSATTTSQASDGRLWHTISWDKTKVQVLYDKTKYQHATPISVSTQLLCHFKPFRFIINKNFKRGLIMRKNPNVLASSTTQKWLNGFVLIYQMGQISDGLPTVTEPLTGTACAASMLYVSYYDL